MKHLIIYILLVHSLFLNVQASILVEVERFETKGGWVTDAQFIDQMGSQYLLAHGLGKPVKDAKGSVLFKETGVYHVWVRTKNWIPDHKGPGEFTVSINHSSLQATFGSAKIVGWHWAYGGTVNITQLENSISLHDKTGFDGRCDAIFFSKSKSPPSNDLDEIAALREKYGDTSGKVISKSGYDLVVVGGGVAGICAAVQSARLGLKVALINNRPVLGGNSSSEIRVSTDGSTFKNDYPKLGRITREIDNLEAGIGGSGKAYKDDLRRATVVNEPLIDLFENMHFTSVDVSNGVIASVSSIHLQELINYRFFGAVFVDCTGDGVLGVKAGADHRYGRESFDEYKEKSAPQVADNMVMGSSNQWNAKPTEKASEFPVKEWMLKFTPEYHFELTHSIWNWESGFNNFHTVDQAEEIRDLNLRAIYSNWAYLKKFKPQKYECYRLNELLYMSGKRESNRLLGDFVLTETDLVNRISYPDAVVTTTWGIDIHYPDTTNGKHFPGQEFIAYSIHPLKMKDFYSIPYRCFYSRNIKNLFMAGRNISVSHIALGAVRVQRCTGMMGELVGYAAFLCKKLNCTPRQLYTDHLEELKSILTSYD